MNRSLNDRRRSVLAKTPTGIKGLDDITFGGLPRGRPTLVCGRAGCGKTLLAAEFLVHGALRYNEPGVFIAFEETEEELTKNVASLGYDLADLCRRKNLFIDYVRIERSEIEETGEYDLEGLFIRLAHAIDTVGAKRVALDTLEAIFAGLPNANILRAELRRLFRWLKDRGVTAIITAERGDGALTRHGLEEYVSDCVIFLDHRVKEQVSTRRLRIVKYRGSVHGTNEYPFLIDERGISVLPITSLGLEHSATSERISSGIPSLDQMLGGKGYYRGSSILVSGTAGTGKTSLAALFVDAACRRGERCIYFASEESSAQIIRNMRSIGVDLGAWVKRGLLRVEAGRPSVHGLETHLVNIHKLVEELKPKVVVFDPLTTFLSIGDFLETRSMLTRLIDFLKTQHITAVFNSLSDADGADEQTEMGVSSLMDAWILLRNVETNGERNRVLYVLKARGIRHSNQVREFVLTDRGIELIDVYLGPEGVLTGSARITIEAQEKAAAQKRQEEVERAARERQRKRNALEAQIAALRAQFENEDQEIDTAIAEQERREQTLKDNRAQIASLRGDGAAPSRGHATARKAKGKADGLSKSR